MMGQTTNTSTAPRQVRRASADAVRLSQRDIDGLLLCGEQYGAPADLLASSGRPEVCAAALTGVRA